MYALQIQTNTIKFHEPTFGQKGQKMIDLSFDETSKAWSQRVIFQVCKNENEALRSMYGISKPREGQDETKRNLELILENESVIEKLKEIDEYVKKYAVSNSKALFRKELTMVEIVVKYKNILKWKEPKDGNEGYYYINVKVNKEKPPPIKVVEHNKMRDGGIDDINPGCKIVPKVRLLFMWFMSDSFGITPQADKFIVFPGKKRKFLDEFILENKYVVEE